jgi:hypothetical protein
VSDGEGGGQIHLTNSLHAASSLCTSNKNWERSYIKQTASVYDDPFYQGHRRTLRKKKNKIKNIKSHSDEVPVVYESRDDISVCTETASIAV